MTADTSMTSIGEILRRERQKQSRSISEIAEQTKISSRYLEAIESGDLDRLPGVFFYKAFVRQYSDALGLPPEQLTRLLDEISRPEPEPVLTPEKFPIKRLDPLVADTNRRFFTERRMGWSIAMLVLVVFGCSGLYAWWHQAQLGQARDLIASMAGSMRTQPAPAPAAAVTPPPAAPSQTAPASPPPAAVPASTSEISGSSSGDTMRISVSATEKTWLSIISDGKPLFSGVLEASESKTLEGKQWAQLRLGNAGGVEVLWNGKSIGPLGGRGQVCTVVFTRENYHIVSPGHEL
jgi:cytoskeletal protein RodZ